LPSGRRPGGPEAALDEQDLSCSRGAKHRRAAPAPGETKVTLSTGRDNADPMTSICHACCWRDILADHRRKPKMSYLTPASSHTRTSKVARLTAAVRKNWTEARYADRRLMEMRTNLSRHAG
jgi:hypothetical protein